MASRRKLVGTLTFTVDENQRAEIYDRDGNNIAFCHAKAAELIREQGDIRPWLGLVKLY